MRKKNEIIEETGDQYYTDLDPNDNSTVTSDLYTGGKQGVEVKFYRVRGGGHTVPSINHPHNPIILWLLDLGNHNHDTESAREAWVFLSSHRLSGSGVLDPGAAFNLRIYKNPDNSLQLTWNPDCGIGDRYGIYRGDLNEGCSSLVPEPGMCSVEETSVTIPEGLGVANFFLIVPNDAISEGSYGIDSNGDSRAPSNLACFPQDQIDSCAP